MKQVLLAILSGLMLVNAQGAPPTDESIEEMMKAVQLEQLIGQTISQMDAALKIGVNEGLKQSLKGKEPTAAQRVVATKCEQKLGATMSEELSIPKIKALYVQAYRDTFTQEEISGIVAFYASPAGQAMVVKLPAAMQKVGGPMQDRIAPLMKRLETMRQECMKDVASAK